jgi:hypothetical protein
MNATSEEMNRSVGESGASKNKDSFSFRVITRREYHFDGTLRSSYRFTFMIPAEAKTFKSSIQ